MLFGVSSTDRQSISNNTLAFAKAAQVFGTSTDSSYCFLFTAVTWDAVRYSGLGHIFNANMTGNIVLLWLCFRGCAGVQLPAEDFKGEGL
jgi:hypothetical protein